MTDMPIVAIVGRPNVGKSALFNRLVGKRVAIVEETAGVTRDRLYGVVHWNGRQFTLVDTGGIETGTADDVTVQTRQQAELAVQEADVILFVVDAKTGPMAQDSDVAGLLRRSAAKVLLVANKVESPATAATIYEFCDLGFGVPLAVSSIHGLQSGDLLDAIVARLPAEPAPAAAQDENAIHLAIVGQPNVGKSSLANLLLGQTRAVVGAEPGTTRDATDTAIDVGGERFVIIDTAGMRRHARRGSAIEQYSSLRSAAAVARADVALVVIDAMVGVTAQDQRIAGLAVEEGKGLIIFVNKIDLVNKESFDREQAKDLLRSEFSFASYAEILFGSALTRKGVQRIWASVKAVGAERRKRIPTAKLNQTMRDAFRMRPPAAFRGRILKLFYATQSDVAPPTFVLFVNDPRLIHFSYQRYLENTLREAFGFHGTPVRFVFRRRVQQDTTDAEQLIAAAAREKHA